MIIRRTNNTKTVTLDKETLKYIPREISDISITVTDEDLSEYGRHSRFSSRQISSILGEAYNDLQEERYHDPLAIGRCLLFYQFLLHQFGAPTGTLSGYNSYVVEYSGTKFIILFRRDSSVSDKVCLYIVDPTKSDELFYADKAALKEVKNMCLQFLVDFLTLRDHYYNEG